MLAVPNRMHKANGWSSSSKQWHPRRLGCDCLLSNSYIKRSGDNAHPCRSPTPTVNGCGLTPPTRTQLPEQEYSDTTNFFYHRNSILWNRAILKSLCRASKVAEALLPFEHSKNLLLPFEHSKNVRHEANPLIHSSPIHQWINLRYCFLLSNCIIVFLQMESEKF